MEMNAAEAGKVGAVVKNGSGVVVKPKGAVNGGKSGGSAVVKPVIKGRRR